MKKLLSTIFSLALLLTVNQAMAQRGPAASPTVTITQDVGGTEMTLIYSRPSLAGRDMSSLAPAGKVWRTGANANTKINFNKDVMLGGEKIAAGEYSMYTIPGDGEWTIIINKAKSWGTQYDESQDVVRFMAKATTMAKAVETFSIMMTDFDKNGKKKANIELAWGNTSVKFPIEVN
jgi:hypothetical protein